MSSLSQNIPATVYLVGAGPGDPGLITVAGAQVLGQADIVIYDYLANKNLLELAPPEAEKIDVGKSGSRHIMTQDQINDLLVQKARDGKSRVVVRLKGGDPYVFGRGGEEAEFLQNNQVPVVIIPGITSGIAGPAYAGIPVTHRDFTTSLTLVTGHEREDADPSAPRVNYEALAKLDGTLVFYMGVKSLPRISQRLSAAGMALNTPVAVIRWATHPHQQTVTGTLENICDIVTKAGITAPAITVVGKVVLLRETLNFFERRPLFGQNVIVTRTRRQASQLAAGLSAMGANVVEAPTIELAEPENWLTIDEALVGIPNYDWVVFTSASGVQAAWKRLRGLKKDARIFGGVNIAAIGPATARALEAIGIVPELVPEAFVGEALATALLQMLSGKAAPRGQDGISRPLRFLLLRADISRPVLRDELRKLNAVIDDVAIYRTARPHELPKQVLELIQGGRADWITFTSASTAENFVGLLPIKLHPLLLSRKTLSIGPVTSAAMTRLGLPVTVEASRHDVAGMLAAMAQAVSETPPPVPQARTSSEADR